MVDATCPSALVPQLRTTDLDGSIRFWVERLGFSLDFRYADFYAGLRRGGLRVHLKRVDAPDPSVAHVRDGGHLHLYLEVPDARAAAAALAARGVALRDGPAETPWGTVEFVVEDDQGHTLYWGSPVARG